MRDTVRAVVHGAVDVGLCVAGVVVWGTLLGLVVILAFGLVHRVLGG